MDRLEKIKAQVNQNNKLIEVAFEDEGRIGVLLMNSKKDLNAMSLAMRTELIEKIQVLDKNPVVKLIILTSKLERVFCAGANIKEFDDINYESLTYDDIFQPLERCLQDTKKPILAAVSGAAFGGGFEISLGCDFIVVREDAKLGLPEINLGLIPGWGGTQRLAKLIGRQNAARHVLTGEPMTAQRAYELGVAVALFKKESFYEDVINFGKKITNKSVHTLMVAKKAVRASEYTNLREGLDYERSVFVPLYNTQAKQEGVTAFKNKKKPNFNNL